MTLFSLLFFFSVYVSLTSGVSRCINCEKEYSNCIKTESEDIRFHCERLRGICLNDYGCHQKEFKSNGEKSNRMRQKMMKRRLLFGDEKKRLSTKEYALSRKLPVPGESHTLEHPVTKKQILKMKLHPNSKYMMEDTTIECNIIHDYSISNKILPTSFIDVNVDYLKDEYNIGDVIIQPLSNLILEDDTSQMSVLNNMNKNIDSECLLMPIVKVVSIENNTLVNGEIRLYVEEISSMFDYISHLDCNLKNLTLYNLYDNHYEYRNYLKQLYNEFYNNKQKKSLKIKKYICQYKNKTTGESYEIDRIYCDIKYGNKSIYELLGTKLGYDYIGVHSSEQPIDSEIQKRRLFSELIRLDENLKRRLFFKKAFGWIQDTIIDPVVEVIEAAVDEIENGVNWVLNIAVELVDDVENAVETFVEAIIDGLSGDINQQKSISFNLGAHIDDTIEKEGCSSNCELDIFLGAGVEVDFETTIELIASYDLFPSNFKPKFEEFSLMAYAKASLEAYVNVIMKSNAQQEWTIIKKEKTKLFFIGFIPVLLKISGGVSLGFEFDAYFAMSLHNKIVTTAADSLIFETGVKYESGSWNFVQPTFYPTEETLNEGLSLDTDNMGVDCSLTASITPYIKLSIGLTLYETIKVGIDFKVSSKFSLGYPKSCQNTNNQCTQNDYGMSLDIDTDLGITLNAAVELAGTTAWEDTMPVATDIYDHEDCIADVYIPGIYEICCINGGDTLYSGTLKPTKQPAVAPTYSSPPTVATTTADPDSDSYYIESDYYGNTGMSGGEKDNRYLDEIRYVKWGISDNFDSLVILKFTGMSTSALGTETSYTECDEVNLTNDQEHITSVILLHGTCSNCNSPNDNFVRGMYFVTNWGNTFECIKITDVEQISTFDPTVQLATQSEILFTGIHAFTGAIIDKIGFQFHIQIGEYQKINFHPWSYYVNDWDDLCDYRAGTRNSVICGVSSYHDDYYEDRRTSFLSCAPDDYYQMEMVQDLTLGIDYKQDSIFTCPDNSYLTRWRSVHDNSLEDRKFQFTCMKFTNGVQATSWVECTWTDWQNEYDGSFDFIAPDYYAISGVKSKYLSYYRDRIFSFRVCKIKLPIVTDSNSKQNDNQIIIQPWDVYKHSYQKTTHIIKNHYNYGVLSGLKSIHSNSDEDRIWKPQYTWVRDTQTIIFTSDGWENTLKGELDFTCGTERNIWITRIESQYSSSDQDRRFKFECSTYENSIEQDCYLTNFVNDYDEEINFQCNYGYGIKSLYSRYDDNDNDRQWRFECCEIKVLGTDTWNYQNNYYLSSQSIKSERDQDFEFNSLQDNDGMAIAILHANAWDSTTRDRQFSYQIRGYRNLDFRTKIVRQYLRPWTSYEEASWLRGCGSRYLITKIESSHDNASEDRRFRIQCTLFEDAAPQTCDEWSSEWTDYNSAWSYSCPTGYALKSIQSIFDTTLDPTTTGRRQFKFLCCSNYIEF